MRVARTDKGVNAAGNVLSLKLSMTGDDIVRDINSHLPEQVQVWINTKFFFFFYLYKSNIIIDFGTKIILGYVVTKQSFHAKIGCDARIYEYLLPSSVFMGPSKRKLGKEQQNENDLKLVYGDGVYYIPRSTPERK